MSRALLRVALFALIGTTAIFPAIAPSVAAEAPIQAEKNPPGDIPDSQVFIDYSSPDGVSAKVPEGWSRTDHPHGALFSDKYNKLDLTVAPVAQAPTVQSVTAGEVAALKANGRAVTINSVKPITLKGGPAIVIDYSTNSDPNPVTNKQIRLEEVRYLLFRNGKLVTLDMAAPLGADNVDQWNLMSNSVRIN
jgi:hypothetical protein